MPQVSEVPPTMLPVEPAQRPGRRVAIWSWLFVLAQIGTLAGCMAIASRPWFLQHDFYPWLAETSGYSLRASGLNCQVLIYGDSTALVGLNPSIIEQRTGLKTCNIAEFGPVHTIVGSDFPLDSYLAHNSPPEVILTMWSPFWFHPTTNRMTHYFPEGLEYALLHDRGPYLWKGLMRHPDWAANFSIWVIRALIMDSAHRLHLAHLSNSKLEAIPRDVRAGFWEYDLPPNKECTAPPVPDWLSVSEKRESIAAFRKRYTSKSTKVFVNISPIADCVSQKQDIRRENAGLYDNQFEYLPIGDFNVGDIHVTREGARHLSEEAADQVLAAIDARSPSPVVRGPAQK